MFSRLLGADACSWCGNRAWPFSPRAMNWWMWARNSVRGSFGTRTVLCWPAWWEGTAAFRRCWGSPATAMRMLRKCSIGR